MTPLRAKVEKFQVEIKSLRAFDFETELTRAQLRSQVKIKRPSTSRAMLKAPRSPASRMASFSAVALQVMALAVWGTSRDLPVLAGFGSLMAFFALIVAGVALRWPR